MLTDGDSGPDSLRAAIEEANVVCDGTVPCTITFFDHPEVIPKTIFLVSPLPEITACHLTIYSVNRSPSLADIPWGINGFTLAQGEGLVFRPRCEESDIIINGFTVTSFPGDGIAIAGSTKASFHFSRLNVSGRSRGIVVDAPNAQLLVSRSTIGNTNRSAITVWAAEGTTIEHARIGVWENGASLPVGASGIFVGPAGGSLTVRSSLIANAKHFGIALARGNSMLTLHDALIVNNLAGAIDWGLDGPTPNEEGDGIPDTPRILSASYTHDRRITRIVASAPGVQIWASRGLSIFSTGYLERFLGVAGETGVLEILDDLRGRWISAVYVEGARVSEVSFAVPVIQQR